MGSLTRKILLVILVLAATSVIFSYSLEGSHNASKISLNDLVGKIGAGQVASIKVSGNDLSVKLSDGTQVVSQKESEAGLTETLKNLGVSDDQIRKVQINVVEPSGWQYWSGIIIPIVLPVILIGVMFWFMFRQAKGGMNQAFNFGRSNIRLSNFSKERITFADVAGLKESKEELVEIVDFLKNPQKFHDLGARIPRGVLLVGQPGTGKTLLARAVAGESNVPFFHVSASEFVEMFVGVGASRIRDAFQTARRAAPSILFIDEIDAVGRQRGAGLGGGNDEREQTLNQILVEMDGFDRDTRVIILAATNRPDILDPALLRPGRFDRRVVLDLPDLNDREEILKIHARDKKISGDVNLRTIAARTPGFSGADLANIMNEAAILTARANKPEITQAELTEAIDKVMLGPERRSRVISEDERKTTAYHEGGHALVAACVKNSDPVHKVTVVSRGFVGGYTMKLPIEERRLKTKSQFQADLAMMMGGYAAEELLSGDVSTGASSDLKEATELSRKLVTRFGMSALGPQTFGNAEELIFLGREISSEKNYSEEVAGKIDAEVAKFIDQAHAVALRVLKSQKPALDAIAEALLQKETLEQEDFYEILKPFKIKPVAAA